MYFNRQRGHSPIRQSNSSWPRNCSCCCHIRPFTKGNHAKLNLPPKRCEWWKCVKFHEKWIASSGGCDREGINWILSGFEWSPPETRSSYETSGERYPKTCYLPNVRVLDKHFWRRFFEVIFLTNLTYQLRTFLRDHQN